MKQDVKRKKQPPYAKRKAAFDTVMAAYRDSQIVPLSAIQYADSGSGTRYAAKPSVTDFRCDVDRVIKKCARDLKTFFEAYVLFDSSDPIESELHAQKLFGDARHNLEQGMGAEFIRRRIYPTKGKGGYFTTVRRQRETKPKT